VFELLLLKEPIELLILLLESGAVGSGVGSGVTTEGSSIYGTSAVTGGGSVLASSAKIFINIGTAKISVITSETAALCGFDTNANTRVKMKQTIEATELIMSNTEAPPHPCIVA